MNTSPFTAALLAGGRSSRMGQDKATLLWEGKALWKRQIELLESLHPEHLLISGRPDGPYISSSYPVVFDRENNLGPLAGLKSLLENCTTPRLLVLAVDMPWMTLSLLQQLLQENEALVPQCEGWWEGTAAVYPREILPLIETSLKTSDRSFQSLLTRAKEQKLIRSWIVPSQFRSCFQSWNSPLM
ncbi:MAG: molybdenum cofactor guanylyltransferase [Verrucomicrobiota bacterium]